MTDKKLHIIITGEQGQGRNFVVHPNAVRKTIITSLIITLFLSVGTVAGIKYFNQSRLLQTRVVSLDDQLIKTRSVIETLRNEKQQIAAKFNKEIDRLDERSKIIQSIMDNIGVELAIEEDPKHSGGPFIEINEETSETLINRADQYLEILRKMPLGRPVPGKISSKFGRRKDPLVKKNAFHPGIDFRGRTGDEIKATADGVVKKATRNKVLGRYVILSHDNGYETIFAHMHKTLVKKGETVQRGQIIGLVGNTGRSTGSHLHYGVRYNDKSIDPVKYLQVADLSLTLNQ
jgi:murein DD-endopeptidase MepM/ murein hydrolase activator NlpD